MHHYYIYIQKILMVANSIAGIMTGPEDLTAYKT